MASRFAVATGNWPAAIWSATAGGAAGSAATPTNADDVTLGKGNQTCTVVAATNLFTSSGTHNLAAGDDIKFITTATLPAPLVAGTTYYVIASGLTATAFKVSATPGGAEVDITDTGSGTHNWGALTVTLDDATPICLSLACYGTLTCTAAADSALTVQNNAVFHIGSNTNLDMSSTNAYSCNMIGNGAASATQYGFTFNDGANIQCKGYPKTRVTRVNMGAGTGTGAVTVTVDDATGWRNGDVVCFATTDSGYTAAKSESVAISGLTGNSFDVTLTYAHADNGYVGNMSSNLTFKPSSTASQSVSTWVNTSVSAASSGANTRLIQDVAFNTMGQGTNTYAFRLHCQHANNSAWDGASAGFKNNAFYDCWQGGLVLSSVTDGAVFDCDIDVNVFVTTKSSATGMVSYSNGFFARQTVKNTYIFRSGSSLFALGGLAYANRVYEGLVVCGASILNQATVFSVDGGSFFGNSTCFYAAKEIRLDNVAIGTEFSAYNTNVFDQRNSGNIEAVDCTFQTSGNLVTATSSTMIDGATIFLNNKDNLTTGQEIYTNQSNTVPAVKRENTTVKNSVSSLKMTCTRSQAITHEFEVLAKAGTALKILVWMQVDASYDNGTYTYPSISISGLDATTVTASGTAACVGAWELVSLDLTSGQAPTGDGLLTVTLSAQSATAASVAYFSGLPLPPFITRGRFYGYVVDETNPARVADPAIDPAISVATAAAYTGIGITWGATSSIATSADTTFKKLVHYTAAKMIDNTGSAMPITWAGAYASPAIFAQGAINISGDTLNGPGSLDMDIYTLTATTPFSYTYTGGTFSQATTVPTFSGGTLNIGAAGTFTFTQAASMTVSATPTSASNYVLSSGTFTGTLTFHNTTAYNITVEVPAGTTTSSAGSPGAGTVTFVSPQVYQSVVITGFTAGSRIYIYDTEGAGELLFNGTVSAGETVISGSTCTWTDATAAAANRVIFLRVAYVNGATAKEFIEVANIGTCGTTDATKTVTYIAAQTADAVYDTNAVTMDGTIFAACGITFTDAATDLVNINISADTVALKTIYAAFAWWIFTSPGIDDDVAYIRAIDPANYELTSMKFRNTSTDPLKITDGYFYDSTGSVENCVDITSPGNIYPMPAHVVAYQTTGTYAITGDLQDALDAIAGVPADVLAAAATTPIHSDAPSAAAIVAALQADPETLTVPKFIGLQ